MSRLIKKYKNRRLYDTEKSVYITVEDLQHYVIEGVIFHVEDSATGKDITNATLLQIFVEMEAGTTQLLSGDLLRQFIRVAHHPMNQSLKTMLEQMAKVMEQQLSTNPYLPDLQRAGDAWNKQMQQYMEQWKGYFNK